MQSNRQTTYKPDINIVSADSVGFFFFLRERELILLVLAVCSSSFSFNFFSWEPNLCKELFN